jgi:hypothetical protein
MLQWGPYTAAFLTSFLLCWTDLHKVAGDKIKYPVTPFTCWPCLRFLCFIGLLAAFAYFLIVDSGVELFQLKIWSRLVFRVTGYTLPWDDLVSRWSKAVVVGTFTITVLRIKLFSLGGSRSVGLDIIYSRARDRCVSIIRQTTLTRQLHLYDEFKGKFTDDPEFIQQFGTLLLAVFSESPHQTPEVSGQISDIESAMKTAAGQGASHKERDATDVVVDMLIRSALKYGDPTHVAKMLRHWSIYKNFNITIGFVFSRLFQRLRVGCGAIMHWLLRRLKDGWAAITHWMDLLP